MKTSAGRSSESFLAQYERRIGNIFLATATLLLLPSIYLERSHRDAVATGSNRNPIRKRNRLARVTSRVPVIGTAVSTVATLSSTTRRRVKVKQWHQVSGTTFVLFYSPLRAKCTARSLQRTKTWRVTGVAKCPPTGPPRAQKKRKKKAHNKKSSFFIFGPSAQARSGRLHEYAARFRDFFFLLVPFGDCETVGAPVRPNSANRNSAGPRKEK